MSSKPPQEHKPSDGAPAYVDIDKLKEPENRAWQSDMLLALQQNAAPEPIRLACMKNLPSRPSFFQEEFHGRIPREEVEELLSGPSGPVNGRYLVRESNSSPGDYSLSLSYGGHILHYRLFYENERFFIDSTDEKKYKSITDLVVDVLNMFRVINHVDGHMPKEEKKKAIACPHVFKPHSYKHFKWCASCGGFMWGIKDQGMKCEGCGLDVHCRDRCMKNVEGECPLTLPCKEKKVPPDALNPCYCEECCLDVETPLCKSGNPPQTYSLPTGWCRFQLEAASGQESIVSSNWNLAFMSLNPKEVVKVLESKTTENHSEDPSEDGSKPLIKMTPSIICADLDAPKLKYTDIETGEVKAGQVVLQAYIEPYSYQMMRRPGLTDEIDPYFKMDTIYWVTRQVSSILPFALLVKTMDATYLKL
ncbi:N-chimaerin [Stylophora pistillata]|uniref:N-chimaerin n=1 Tax=Stylophora pistillata TaxID=50429 RepID=A0A2B4SKB3_STYPI|nr:N-chimaerin [Stylophora pistillata]